MLKNPKMKSTGQTKAFRARWLMLDSDTWISDGYVEILSNGLIKNCGSFPKKQLENLVDLGDGILMPSLINAHTHLELSALKNRIPMHMGFQNWVSELIKERLIMGPERLISEAKNACQFLWENGICTVGEISSLGLTRDLLINSKLNGVYFYELFGNEIPDHATLNMTSNNISLSFAGHAPHTTSPNLFRELKQKTCGKPFSIHVAESELEIEFITSGKGPWADFLVSREVDFKNWNLPQKSPVQHLDFIGVLDSNTLIVHLLHFDESDANIIIKNQCPVCVCPRSNQNLHKSLPDIELMIQKGITVCLGTDSLASVDSLSIWDEMKYVYSNYPNLSPKKILSMATQAGAKALGYENHLGCIAPGYSACLIYIPINDNSVEKITHKMVAGDFSKESIQCIQVNKNEQIK